MLVLLYSEEASPVFGAEERWEVDAEGMGRGYDIMKWEERNTRAVGPRVCCAGREWWI